MELICIFSRQLNLNWLKYPLLVLLVSYKFDKFLEIKVLSYETISQNIKKMTGPSKIRSYNNMNNHFHQCIKDFEMESIFGLYLPILGLKLLKINQLHVTELKNTYKIASCNYLQERYSYQKIYLVGCINNFSLLNYDIFNHVKRNFFQRIEKL